MFYETRAALGKHTVLAIVAFVALAVGGLVAHRRRSRRGGFFRLGEDKDGLLGGNSGGKYD